MVRLLLTHLLGYFPKKAIEEAYNTILSEYYEKVDSKDKEEAEKLIEETKKALETDEVEKIKDSRDKLLAKANELATKGYEEAAKANGGQAPNMEDMMKNAQAGEESKNDDNTVDAEFEEK